MRKLNANIPSVLQEIGGDAADSRRIARTFQVHERYKKALEAVYRQNADVMLAHTNSVYIFDKKGVKTLTVYMDESIFAADLNAQRELIQLKLAELFSEHVEKFDIHISRGQYKNRHPFLEETAENRRAKKKRTPLSKEENQFVEQTVDVVENPILKEKIKKAITANLEWKDQTVEKLPKKDSNNA